MITAYILFLPAVACLFWVIVHAILSPGTYTFYLYAALMIAFGVFLATDALYSSSITPISVFPANSLVALGTAPVVIPLAQLYLRRLHTFKKERISSYIWVFIPVVMLTGGVFLSNLASEGAIASFLDSFYSIGIEKSMPPEGTPVRIYYIWVVVVFRILIGSMALIHLGLMIYHSVKFKYRLSDMKAFFFDGAPIRLEHLQTFNVSLFFLVLVLKLIIFRDFIAVNQWLAILMALLLVLFIFLMSYAALFSAAKELTLREMLHSWRFNYSEATKADRVEEMIADLVEEAEAEALRRIQGKIEENLDVEGIVSGEHVSNHLANSIFSAVANSWDDDSLLSRFQSLMVNERLFLRQGLTVSDVAERLHTNKTYISKMVNNTYNLGFPELINTLRIDFAEEYILNHPNAKQDEVAQACGFQSASSFNNIFKKVTGLTPRMWVATRENQK